MNPVFKKLHLIDNDTVLVLNAPEEYYNLLDELSVEIHDEVQDNYNYVQVFAQEQEEANDVIAEVITSLTTDAYFWFCYPKIDSEKYETELDEDSVSKIFELFDFKGVTMVSLNEDWHAVRLKSVGDDEEDYVPKEKELRKFTE